MRLAAGGCSASNPIIQEARFLRQEAGVQEPDKGRAGQRLGMSHG